MSPELLAGCHGYMVVAMDGPCGSVETPLFPPDCAEPDFLVVRVGSRLKPRFPIVPAALVERVDSGDEVVRLGATRDEVRRLPEQLPLAI